MSEFLPKSEFEKQFGVFAEKLDTTSGNVYGMTILSDSKRKALKTIIEEIEDLLYLRPVCRNWGKEVSITSGEENGEPLVRYMGDPVESLWSLYWADKIEYIINPKDEAREEN